MKFEQVEKKVKNPPAAHNVARLLDPESEMQTVENIARFAVSIPAFNYLTAQTVIRDRVGLSLDLETALKTVGTKGAPAGRENNKALVRAFYKLDEKRNYSASQLIESYRGQFRISRDISVPTFPTFTILENGKQVPVVLCGWKRMPLRREQTRAWLSMLESGLFSIADYARSPWEVLIFAEEEATQGTIRKPRVIRPGDYTLLTETDLRDLAAMYARAQDAAMPLARELWDKRERARKEKLDREKDIHPASPQPVAIMQPELFAFGEGKE